MTDIAPNPPGSTPNVAHLADWYEKIRNLINNQGITVNYTNITSKPTTFTGYGIATTSLNLAASLTDETGSGAAVFANTPTLITPTLGTPGSGTLTNCTGLPIATGVSGLGANVAALLATFSSANLAAALTDETGAGAAVFADTPTLVTPVIGAATGTSLDLTGNITTGTGTLHKTTANLTNGAAAAAGTLGNAPSAGNPTKWVPIDDNGTIRYIPCW
jgi:hypothetical protein